MPIILKHYNIQPTSINFKTNDIKLIFPDFSAPKGVFLSEWIPRTIPKKNQIPLAGYGELRDRTSA